MNTYEFYQDIKVSVWQRQHFEIEAESKEEAKRIAMKFRNRDVSDEEEFSYAEELSETESFIRVEDNNGEDTIQLYLKGEENPFATNGNSGLEYFDEFKDAEEVAYRDMAKSTVETTDSWDGMNYYAFHADNKLNIVVARLDERFFKYAFNESWDELVNGNECFRTKMAKYLMAANVDDAPYIHDWLAGHLTEMKNTSDAVDNKVPFDLHDIIDVWGDETEKTEYKPAALIGFQVVDREGNFPEGMKENEIVRNKQKASQLLNKVRMKDPAREFHIFPVYEGEIEAVSFV